MMMSVLFLPFLLLASLVPGRWATSEPNFSGAKSPVIFLKVRNLEPKRDSLSFGNDVVPMSNGFLYLQCDIMLQSLASVPDGLLKNATLSWELPNGRILEEKRAYQSFTVGGYRKNSARLAITNFLNEDSGEYTCRLNFDGKPTEYKRSIYVPGLDGSPLMTCELSCTRNQDNNCQLMEYFSIRCEAFGFPEPRVTCKFDECPTEDACPLPLPSIPDPFFGFGSDQDMYIRKDELAVDTLALRSGRYLCEGKTHKGSALVTLFAPVSYGEEKQTGPSLPRPPPLPVPVPGGPPGAPSPPGAPALPPLVVDIPKAEKIAFIGKLTPEYYDVDEEVKMTCWTNDPDVGKIQWTYRNASSPDTVETLTNGQNPDYEFIVDESVSGGQLSQIVVRFAKLEHGGIYECSATRASDGSKVSRELVMETYRWGDDADMNQNREVTRTIGGSVTMRCTVITTKSDPQVNWLKDGIYLDSNTERTFSANKQVLTITNLSPSDTGVYTCSSRARFNLGPSDLQGKTTLTVTDAADPEIHVQSINKAISSLTSVQESLAGLALDLSAN